MKKEILILLVLSGFTIRAQLLDFTDNSTQNSFLGLNMSMCSTKGQQDQGTYDCGNDTITQFLNLNILNPELLGKQFYIYNNFMYWMSNRYAMGNWNGKDSAAEQQASLAASQPGAYFSGSGVFMIVLGTTPYLQQIVTPKKTCSAGQTLVVAQLKYNDGTSISCWSQDSMCMAPTDSFSIAITKDQDNTVPAKSTVVATTPDAQSINWMQDAGPSANYSQAGSSPRQIRLVSRGSSAPVAKVVPPSTVPAA